MINMLSVMILNKMTDMDIALRRFAEGFEPKEICDTLNVFREIIIKKIMTIKKLVQFKQDVYNYIGLTI